MLTGCRILFEADVFVSHPHDKIPFNLSVAFFFLQQPVMLSLEYAQSMGHLVEAILRRTLEEIEAQTDISETESKQLNILCKSLHQLSDLFGDGAKQVR